MQRQKWAGFFFVLAGLMPASRALSQEGETQQFRNISVRFDGESIDARQGRDETGQHVRVTVWGSLRDPSFFSQGFTQLDDDPEEEYVVVSRNPGTGSYYKLQIIDFRVNGILTWAYDSRGKPRFDGRRILLGCSRDDQEATITPQYRTYEYSASGLTPVDP